MNANDFYYANRACPECEGYQKNCEHYWAGYVNGRKFASLYAKEILIGIIESGEWVGETLSEDISNLKSQILQGIEKLSH